MTSTEKQVEENEGTYKPNLFDPKLLKDHQDVIPDDYISFRDPFDLTQIRDIPIRLLTTGEAMTFIFAITDKSPQMPDHIKDKKRSELNADERQLYTQTQEQIDAVMDEAYTDVLVDVVLQPGWDRESIAKLPLSTRYDGYIKAMRGIGGEASLSAETFLETRDRGMSENTSSLSSGTGSE